MPNQDSNDKHNDNKKKTNWYSSMPSFQAFKEITNDAYYRTAPDDWHVVITDVKGSTKAIEEGRYKDVNTIGAASISTVKTLLEHDNFPYVFGGDGATMMVPPDDIDRVLQALLKLQRLSERTFDLGLRVGHISVREVHHHQANTTSSSRKTIQVAKHELTAGKCVAVFRGGGLTVAESKIKGEEDKYCVVHPPNNKKRDNTFFELSGLSCRWNPVPSKRGKIMSLLVLAREDDHNINNNNAIYNHVLSELDQIYNGELETENPVHTELMTYRTVLENIRNERRFYLHNSASQNPVAFLKRLSEIVYAGSVFRSTTTSSSTKKPKQLAPWAAHYKASMRDHADHRKFDDMLRMIIDCSDEQATRIESILEGMRRDDKIYYGIFKSDTALMTCYVEDLSDGHHIHFVDGGDGGYAMAAKQLKAQLKEQ
ncbi:Protein of unknown function (DUF3095) [Seminavis robusta]|uniref:DUF3095 domain-containing protein n=1 Tax=Seminavis robusta TaxID=568900 RepID=A0A9N8E7S5_9STRA|nr:Protein of unknown function (DUF3095) [Seminavis robusta]|eukprot:Sro774_g200680.1 Protein of unknown function (DUF3095) (427) ;mRNA; f:30873-32153